MKNPFAHNPGLSPVDEAIRREKALADGLRRLAKDKGKTFEEPLQITSLGEFLLVARGGFGGDIAVLLNASGGARTGINPTRYLEATNNWCYLNHFAAQSILEKVYP